MVKAPQLHRQHPLEGHLWQIQRAGAALRTWLNRSSWNRKGGWRGMSLGGKALVRPCKVKSTWHLDNTVLFQNLPQIKGGYV